MDLGLRGQTALVLSSRGLGSAMAFALAQESVQVAVASITPASVEAKDSTQ